MKVSNREQGEIFVDVVSFWLIVLNVPKTRHVFRYLYPAKLLHYLIETRMCFSRCVYAFGWFVGHDGSRASSLAKESVKRWLSEDVFHHSRVVNTGMSFTH
jgi:hypothetical protein